MGLMGAVADGALEAGGDVVGVMPTHLVEREIAHSGLTELITVDTMHERKTKMSEFSSAFLAMPGGAGTMKRHSSSGPGRKSGFTASLWHFSILMAISMHCCP